MESSKRNKVRVAIIGAGNCASSLVQGVEFYRDADEQEFTPGLMHALAGGYRKLCLERTTFGNVPLGLELKLEVWDSPNMAGVVIDAARCFNLALDRGIGGLLIGPSSYFIKSPQVQFCDSEAHELSEAFIRGQEAFLL